MRSGTVLEPLDLANQFVSSPVVPFVLLLPLAEDDTLDPPFDALPLMSQQMYNPRACLGGVALKGHGNSRRNVVLPDKVWVLAWRFSSTRRSGRLLLSTATVLEIQEVTLSDHV